MPATGDRYSICFSVELSLVHLPPPWHTRHAMTGKRTKAWSDLTPVSNPYTCANPVRPGLNTRP
jgi:hypothetical protein